MLYTTGTVNMVNGSATVVGVGTAFVANVNTGATPDGFLIDGEGVYYTVLSVTDDTHLTLSVNYAGTTGDGKSYQVARDWDALLGFAEIQPGDPNWPYLLTQFVTRKISTLIATGHNIPNNLAWTLKDSTGATTLVKVDEATGNIGIGTANPSAQLHIAKTDANAALVLQALGTGQYSAANFGDDEAISSGQIRYDHTADRLEFTSNSIAQRMVIDSNGDCGIGTVTPGSYLASTKGLSIYNSTTPGMSLANSSGYWLSYISGTEWRLYNGTANKIILKQNGDIGFGMTPTVGFEIVGSVAQKASGTTWSNPSDERLKIIRGSADVQRCYDDIKALPLLRYSLRNDCFTEEQVKDRTVTGVTANDVQKIIPKAVNVIPFTKVPITDGEEEYQEQDFVVEQVEVSEVKIINGLPVLIKEVKEQKRLLFDEIQVLDEKGNPIFQKKDKKAHPLTHSIPRMITKTRPKYRAEVIEDCLNLDMSQVYMQMLGAVQMLQKKVEALEAEIVELRAV